MKRSEVNGYIRWAIEFLDRYGFRLPGFAYWTTRDWNENFHESENIRKLSLGWDITDYGLDRFEEVGGVLFTMRNGHPTNNEIGTPYAEKIIILKEGQRIPLHMHKQKTEDIINRFGGTFSIKLYQSTCEGKVDTKNDVIFESDGILKRVHAGAVVEVMNGNSITLKPGIYHEFWANEAPVIIGEVSSINDDDLDNYFVDEVSRFSKIEEDEDPIYPLCNEH